MSHRFLPTHRLFLLILSGLFLVLILWVIFAPLDIVITAQGKLVPWNFVSVAQPSESGIVRDILVKDGDLVQEGQTLIAMDPVLVKEDTESIKAEVLFLEKRKRMLEALIAQTSFTDDDLVTQAEYEGRRSSLILQIAEAKNALAKAKMEQQVAGARASKSRKLAPVAIRQEEMLGRLKTQGFVSEAMYNDKLRDRLDFEGELSVQSSALQAANASVELAQSSFDKIRAEQNRLLANELNEVQLKYAQSLSELNKRMHRASLTEIKAPVSGLVTGLAIHNKGQVVAAGAQILSLVPDKEPLRFEGWIRNEDSSQIMLGQPTKVKLSAYPFQKYGWLEGNVSWVGIDSETPEAMRNTAGQPLFYKVRVDLSAQALKVNDKVFPVKPGQQAISDIQLGTRTIWEFLTSPMKKIVMEAGREH